MSVDLENHCIQFWNVKFDSATITLALADHKVSIPASFTPGSMITIDFNQFERGNEYRFLIASLSADHKMFQVWYFGECSFSLCEGWSYPLPSSFAWIKFSSLTDLCDDPFSKSFLFFASNDRNAFLDTIHLGHLVESFRM